VDPVYIPMIGGAILACLVIAFVLFVQWYFSTYMDIFFCYGVKNCWKRWNVVQQILFVVGLVFWPISFILMVLFWGFAIAAMIYLAIGVVKAFV
jgi:hypothetical protein